MSESVVGRGTIELVADARKLRAGIEDAKKSIRTLGEGQKDISKSASASIDNYIGKLQAQNAMVKKSATEIELYKLALRGASKEQIATAETALKMRDAQQKNAAIMSGLKSGFMTLGAAAAAGIGAAVLAFDHLLNQTAKFQDMSEKIGDSGENVASLAVAARIGGIEMNALASASVKLTKSLTGVDDESDAAGAALTSLGLNIADFKQLSPVERIDAIAKAMAKFKDGSEKTAVAVALFGKSGAEMLPFLKELGNGIGRVNILTDEQIRLADEYADKQARTRAEIELYAQSIAGELLPAYNEVTEAAKMFLKELAGIEDGTKGMKNADAIQEWGRSVADVLAFVADAGVGVVRVFELIGKAHAAQAATAKAILTGQFAQVKTIYQEFKADAEKILNAPLPSQMLEKVREAKRKAKAEAETDGWDLGTQELPKLEFEGATKVKNEQLKIIDEVAKARQSAVDKSIAADKAMLQARLATTAGFLASQTELERAELNGIARRVEAATKAFDTEQAVARSRGDKGEKANEALLKSGRALYDNLIARNQEYLSVYVASINKVMALDKQIADNRKTSAELIRGIEEAGFTNEQKIGSARTRALDAYDSLRHAVLTGNMEDQKKFLAETQKVAGELAQLGQTGLAKQYIEDAGSMAETGLQKQKLDAQSIATAAQVGAESVQKQLETMQQTMATITDTALKDMKVGVSDASLKELIKNMREAIESETFKVNLVPQQYSQANIGDPIGNAQQLAVGGLGDNLAMVGERGRELVRFLQPAEVYSAQNTRKIMSNIGGDNVRALASGGIVRPTQESTAGTLKHDISINGQTVARVEGPTEQVQNLVDALKIALGAT